MAPITEEEFRRSADALRAVLDRGVEALERYYGYVSGLTYEGEDDPRTLVVWCMRAISAAGLRHLYAARGDIRDGWPIESVAHSRVLWELAIDGAFLLSLSGRERFRMSERYQAALFLRNPFRRLGLTPDSYLEEIRTAREAYPEVEESDHWSGWSKRAVRDAAYRQIVAQVPKLDARDLKPYLFDAMGSSVAHADPGILVFGNWERGKPRAEPESNPAVEGAGTSVAVLSSATLMAALSGRGREEHKNAARNLVTGYQLAIEVGSHLNGENDRERRTKTSESDAW